MAASLTKSDEYTISFLNSDFDSVKSLSKIKDVAKCLRAKKASLEQQVRNYICCISAAQSQNLTLFFSRIPFYPFSPVSPRVSVGTFGRKNNYLTHTSQEQLNCIRIH